LAQEAPPAPSSSSSPCDLGSHVTFADSRRFLLGGTTSVTGDELQFKPSCSAGNREILTIFGTTFSMERSSPPSPGGSVLEVTGVSSSHSDQVVASVVGPPALSST